MQIYSITQLLTDLGFAVPALDVLKPNHENYDALLFQPQGDIEADVNGVRNANQPLAQQQHLAFLTDAANERVALAVTPEYSAPWQTVEASIRAELVPTDRSLWVIGCESITLQQLEELKERISDVATVIYEQLAPVQGRFLDPVLYIFKTQQIDDTANSRLSGSVQNLTDGRP